jgi:hypothetical protein
MNQGPIWGRFMKKTRGQKSRATVPLISPRFPDLPAHSLYLLLLYHVRALFELSVLHIWFLFGCKKKYPGKLSLGMVYVLNLPFGFLTFGLTKQK